MPDSQASAAKQYVIAPPEQAAIAVEGSDKLFPVRRIWCVGRNYADHAREMGHDPDREPPFFFQKPSDAVMPNHSAIPYPPKTNDLQHEIELVVCIGKGGKSSSKGDGCKSKSKADGGKTSSKDSGGKSSKGDGGKSSSKAPS